MFQANRLQREIAAAAARLMAEDGLDIAQAKRKAAADIAASSARRPDALPGNDMVETALREHLRTFAAQSHSELLQDLRRLAIEWMNTLAAFRPHLVGPVLSGSATSHSYLELHLFTDSAKDVELALLELGIAFRVAEAAGAGGRAQEAIGFTAPRRPGAEPVSIVLTVFDTDAQRAAPAARSQDPSLHPIERMGRASLSMVEQLLAQTLPSQAS